MQYFISRFGVCFKLNISHDQQYKHNANKISNAISALHKEIRCYETEKAATKAREEALLIRVKGISGVNFEK